MSENTAHQEQAAVLVSDLDGTLCRTDTLIEMILSLVVRQPLAVLHLPSWLARGRAHMKAKVADFGVLHATDLPMNASVSAALVSARTAGQQTVLVSAADHRQVTAIAEETGLFDEAYGTAEGLNLKGDKKAAFLIERYGAGGFDYIGDSAADLPVWKAARQAITVGARPALRRAAEAVNTNVQHIDPPQGKWMALARAARPHQWSKNLLIFLPSLAAHQPDRLPAVFLAFLAFCLTASAVYVINDLLDLSADRDHPRKCKRPFAAGELSAVTGFVMSAVLLTLAVLLSALIGNLLFLGTLLLYLCVTFLYSFWLKRKLLIDVFTLAGLYTVRVMAGAAAALVALSPWLLAFSMFLFLCLAAVKRQAELMDLMQSGRGSAGRAYEVEDLPMLRGMAVAASYAAVLVLALYVSSESVQELYAQPIALWMICPLLLYWSLRMVMKAHRGRMPDDPIVFAATDPTSLVLIAASGLVVFAAI